MDMQRVFRRKRKLKSGLLPGGFILAVLVCSAVLLPVIPANGLRALSVWMLGRSQPSVVKYVIHMETPRMSLLERLLSPQLMRYSFQTAARNGTITETSGDAVYDASDGADTSLQLSVGTEYQTELLQENIYGETETETESLTQSSGNATSNLTVFDEITGQNAAESLSPVKQRSFNLADFDSLEALIEEFYVVDSSTRATASLINLDSLTSYDCTISKEDEAPQILIYHSHSQETYINSDENDPSTTIVGVGGYLSELLESYGYSVLHHEGTYDVPSRDDAYSKALPAIEALLEEYPSIEVVIDLHRDAVAEGTRLVYTYDGKDYARFMFFNGISRTASGPIDYLYNENLSANLAFSFQAEVIAESYFPGVTRGIYLKAWRYNMHLMPKYMLIELGAQTNTVEEAMNTCEILAFVLDQVLSGESD
ncbi:MAG: stage II sporulation protein P [Lachnospiraceae bacterium]|nr:stage II sporulation protein P [Lachnospiraceae bacterium]